jgi:thiol:disulfide interchange protein
MRSIRFFALVAVLTASSLLGKAVPQELYPAPERAKADVAAALRTAAATHKRVLLDFGGNWCGDCRVLDLYMENATNAPIVRANYVVVHINVGYMDQNLDLARQYEVPLQKGVPALAVLNDKGRLLYSQKQGEFESMRRMESSTVTQFLIQWKPVKPGCSAVAITC